MHRSLDSRSFCKIKSVYLSTVKRCYKTSVCKERDREREPHRNKWGRPVLILNQRSNVPSTRRPVWTFSQSPPSWATRKRLTNKSFAYTNFVVCEFLVIYFLQHAQKTKKNNNYPRCDIKWVFRPNKLFRFSWRCSHLFFFFFFLFLQKLKMSKWRFFSLWHQSCTPTSVRFS